MNAKLTGKVVFITGGRRGIGGACAERLRDEGARVVVTSRSAAWRAQAPAPADGEVVEQALDVTEPAQVGRLFDWIDRQLGALDVLVNNAGVGHFGPLIGLKDEQWREMLDTNLTGPFLCTRAAWPLLVRGGGRVINVGSIVGEIPVSDTGGYGASKFGLRGLNGVINEEGEALGVRATLLSLGAVATEIWEGREGFDAADMLPMSAVTDAVSYLVAAPTQARIEELKLWPPKGIL